MFTCSWHLASNLVSLQFGQLQVSQLLKLLFSNWANFLSHNFSFIFLFVKNACLLFFIHPFLLLSQLLYFSQFLIIITVMEISTLEIMLVCSMNQVLMAYMWCLFDLGGYGSNNVIVNVQGVE